MSLRPNTSITNNHGAAGQFQQWARDRDAFRNAAADADRQRASLERELEKLRAEQKLAAERIQQASMEVGCVHRERDMLLKERDRLQKELINGRNELEQCAAKIDAFRADESNKKQEFCRQMKDLNDELGGLLVKQEDFRLQQLLSVETLPLVLEQCKSNDASPASNDGTAEALQEALRLLMEKTQAYKEQIIKYQRLQTVHTEYRSRALHEPVMQDGSTRVRIMAVYSVSINCNASHDIQFLF